MSMSAQEQRRLAMIEAELSADRRLVTLAGYIGKPAAQLRRYAALALLWLGFPLAVGAVAGLVIALVVGIPVLVVALIPVLALLWPVLVLRTWRRWRRRPASAR